ncbi:MAG: D-ribose pyranase [Candidatus Celerinatantimonas neptuna]|nr:MAG: D-ribose pyranase [Candidatus Celerinatantimonas neptuna]
MKQTALIHSDLSYLVACLGHTDEITLADAGFPIPSDVQRIDLAVTPGIPDFFTTLSTLLTEMTIEGVLIAQETAEQSPEFYQKLLNILEDYQSQHPRIVSIQMISHEELKERTERSKAVVRTGECTPFANLILQAGVAF